MSRVWQGLFLLALFFPGVPVGILLAEEVDLKNLPSATKVQVDFYRDIEPLLKERCQSCHGPAQQLSGLRLDDRKAALAGGNTGAVIKPGNSADSRLIHLVAGLNKELRMPLNGEPLTTEQIALLRGWIDQGALWPERAGPAAQPSEARSPPAEEQTLGFCRSPTAEVAQGEALRLDSKSHRQVCLGSAGEGEHRTLSRG